PERHGARWHVAKRLRKRITASRGFHIHSLRRHHYAAAARNCIVRTDHTIRRPPRTQRVAVHGFWSHLPVTMSAHLFSGALNGADSRSSGSSRRGLGGP